MRSFAGIGSRQTPSDVFDLMVEVGRLLVARHGLRGRSGGAKGSDTAIANGIMLWDPAQLELYLPWPEYNGIQVATMYRPTPAAYELAERYHPFWPNLKPGARHLHARNSHIILGEALDDPVDFVLCYTPDGSLDGYGPHCGGTGQGLRMAADYGIPAFNLALPQHRAWVEQYVGI